MTNANEHANYMYKTKYLTTLNFKIAEAKIQYVWYGVAEDVA